MEFDPRDRAAYVPAADALVCADLHVGRDATSNVEVRLGEREDLTERFEALLERYDPAIAVVAGDLLHSFGSLPAGVIETVEDLRGIADRADCRVVVTPGNHDAMLETLWEGPTEGEYRLEGADADVVICHGHRLPELSAEWYVVGHDHPTIEIEGVRRPCHLVGVDQFDGSNVLMLPSFSRLPAGVAVNRMYAGDFQSPLVTNANALRPVVRDEDADETHEFPPLGEFRTML